MLYCVNECMRMMVFQSEWLHQYEACGEYIQKMTPDDFLEFVFAATFSEQIISQVCTTNSHFMVSKCVKV